MKNKTKSLLFYIVITLIIGSVPSIFVYTNNVYEKLNKPFLSPPGILFPIVWSILFILMGVSIYRVNKYKRNYENPNFIYFFQLIVNSLWTPIFFGLNFYFFAFLWLILLIVLVLIMYRTFYKIDKTSAYINIPYIIWLLFAGYLNLFIFILN